MKPLLTYLLTYLYLVPYINITHKHNISITHKHNELKKVVL